MNLTQHSIAVDDVSLAYDLYFDRTLDIKGQLINLLRGNKFVNKKKDKHWALKNINFVLKDGERLGIVGANGAGKSTLLKVLSGILKPTSGYVAVEGTVQPLIEIGAGFNPEFSGRENIYFNGYMLGFTKAQIREKEKEIIEFSELKEFIDVPVKYYSSGMHVRLAFTIATSIDPEILVFDELLSAGDLQFIGKAKKRMNRLLDAAKMMVLASHDLSMVQDLTHKIIVLDKGQMQYFGSSIDAVRFYKEMIAERSLVDA